jgi:pimeloyl-ACP methyl ester carboxylesterase
MESGCITENSRNKQMKYISSQLESRYHQLPITIAEISAPTRSATALVLHPGAFEFLWGDNERYKNILAWFREHVGTTPHCFSYQTSRQAVPVIPGEDRVSYWKRLFPQKTFADEIDDVRTVYARILSRTMGEGSIDRVFSVGFSVGGTISLLLTAEFPQLQKVCTVGSAISTKRPSLPVLTGYPDKREILEKIKPFRGSLLMLQGFAEEVVPFEDTEEVIHNLCDARYLSLVRLKGANHMFSANNRFGLMYEKKLLTMIQHFMELEIEI